MWRHRWLAKKDICVIIPALNEESTVGEVIRSFPRDIHGRSVLVLVVDNGSTDRTAAVAAECGAEVIFEWRRGKGHAIRRGLESVDAEVYVFIDADGTYLPREVNSIIYPILDGAADMVIGSRIDGLMEEGSMTRLNRIGNRLINCLFKVTFKSEVGDVLSGYRAASGKSLHEIVLMSSHFEIETEMTVEFLLHDLRVVEVPITYCRRIGGPSKLRPFRDGMRILRSALFLVMNTRPLFFFSLMSLSLFAASLVLAGLLLSRTTLFGDFPPLGLFLLSCVLAAVGTVTFLSGLIGELIVTTRRRLEYLVKRQIRHHAVN